LAVGNTLMSGPISARIVWAARFWMPGIVHSSSPLPRKGPAAPRSRELYETFARMIGLHDDRPDGLIVHKATELEDGTVRMVAVRESAEHLAEFRRTRVVPAFEGSGHEVPVPEVFEDFDVVR